MSTPDRDERARLAALAGWQRGELDRIRAEAAVRSVTERAIGMLMERLGCPAEEAGQQLTRLAAEAGVSAADIAADIAGESLAVPAAARRRTTLAAAAAAAAPDAARLAEALLAEVLAAEGAEAVAVWLLAADGGLELAGEAGFGPLDAARWRRVPPDMAFLPLHAVHTDAEIWLPAGPPPGGDRALIGGQHPRARAVLPLRQAGTCFGALEVCWPSSLPAFGESVRRQLTALSRPAAQALAAGAPAGTIAADYSRGWAFGLLGAMARSVLFARAMRDDDGNLTGLMIDWAGAEFLDPKGRTAADVTGRRLLEIYPEAARPDGLLDAAARVLASGEPERIGGMQLTPGGPRTEISIARLFDGVVIAWQDVGEAAPLGALLELAQQLGRTGAWEENPLTGQVRWTSATYELFGLPPGHPVPLADVHQRVPAEDVPAVRAFRDRLAKPGQPGTVTAAFRVIRADDASIRQLRAVAQPVTGAAGELVGIRGAYQDVSDRYHAQATITATHDRLVHTERRAREEHELALRLQEAITPRISQPVEAAGIEVAARYRPAGQAHLVGGDWYDAVLLPGKNVLLAVGDIAGHGTGAVTGMVALRNHLRGLAVTEAGPAALLTWLNIAAFHLAGVMATVICGSYDPGTRTLRWARAGHLPPLLVRNGQARLLSPPDGTLLGADPDCAYQEATTRLQIGDALILFTDGLVERRHESLDHALDDLAQLASQPAGDIGAFADSLLARAASDTGDDACLLAVAIR